MKKNTIFIHIPKTGGTTINTAMQGSYWLTEPDFHYRHIVEKTKTSNAGDIFKAENFQKYKDYTVFMMLRHPIDKLISEYYFFKERENLMAFFQKKPTTLKNYILNYQAQNTTLKFLKGRRLYDIRPIHDSDLDDVLDAIDQIPIHIGIFEDFANSMQYFSEVANLEWKKEIEVKRITFKRPKSEELSDEIKALILQNNQLDLELYNYGLQKFNLAKKSISVPQLSFSKDKYTHVIPYVAKTCLFEFCMENKTYIKKNFQFFKDLTFYLLKEKKVRDGKVFTKTWNGAVLNAIHKHFPNSDFDLNIHAAFNEHGDPLDECYKIGQNIQQFLKSQRQKAHPFFSPMLFSKDLVPEVEAPLTKKTKGFFSRLFKK